MDSSHSEKRDEHCQFDSKDHLMENTNVDQNFSHDRIERLIPCDSDSENNEIAQQGFSRYREDNTNFIMGNSPSSESSSFALPLSSPTPSDSIAEYCSESLYSYSFTPLSRINKAARIKKQILNRGMDYMQRIRSRIWERDTGRRFSQPDIGILDRSNVEWPNKTGTNTNAGISSHVLLKKSPSLNDSNRNHFAATDLNFGKNSLQPAAAAVATDSSVDNTTLAEHNNLPSIQTNFPVVDGDEFYAGRRQTIQGLNNLPPIYEATPSADTTATAAVAAANNTSGMQLPSLAQYNHTLHAPSRFLPQNQAIITTDGNSTILLFNDMTSLCFGIDKSYIGKSILEMLEEPFRKQIDHIMERRRRFHSIGGSLSHTLVHDTKTEKGLVLVCGMVVPIQKMNGDASSAASLWLKEKKTDEGKNIYIWIFEEIYETSVKAHLDDEGNVVDILGSTTKDLFGYKPSQIIGNPITQLIPALTNGNLTNPGVNLKKIDRVKFYGGRSKHDAAFPTMIAMSNHLNTIKIVSLPSIAGLITVHNTGKIQSINPVPAKYLFGYSCEALLEKFNIDQIIPQFSDIVTGLRRSNLLQYSCTVNNHVCRWAISESGRMDTSYKSMEVQQSLKSLERKSSVSASGQTLPLIYAVHRDGSQFEIQLQLRLIESEEENLISIWVTYDRIHALKRAKRASMSTIAKQQPSETHHDCSKVETSATLPTPNDGMDAQYHPLSQQPPSVDKSSIDTASSAASSNQSTPHTSNENIHQLIALTKLEEINKKSNAVGDDHEEVKDTVSKPKRPPIRPYGISVFGSVDQKKALFPTGASTSNSSSSSVNILEEDVTMSSLDVSDSKKKQQPQQQQQHPMDAYVIMRTLGEGAYGTAKLAYRKDDLTKTKVVIKFIAKSRIVIDSWIRDRKMGLIPLEIHILNKLKENPQPNCSSLETFMEDDDHYFVVMKLEGGDSMDLFDFIELNERTCEAQIKDIFKQIAIAVQHIQSLCIVHRDIKDENVLLDNTGCVHLIDFGSAAYFKKGRTFDTFGGTLDYCAPEILKGMSYEGPAQDVWSLGTLLYTLVYRENPFYNVDEIMEHDLRIPFVLSEALLDLIQKMLNRDVEKRYTITQVLEHPWLKEEEEKTTL